MAKKHPFRISGKVIKVIVKCLLPSHSGRKLSGVLFLLEKSSLPYKTNSVLGLTYSISLFIGYFSEAKDMHRCCCIFGKIECHFCQKTYQLLVITICSFGMTLLHTFLCTACCMYAKKCALLRRYEIGLSEKSISGLVFLFGLQNMAIFFLF